VPRRWCWSRTPELGAGGSGLGACERLNDIVRAALGGTGAEVEPRTVDHYSIARLQAFTGVEPSTLGLLGR
jgi:hypothetical protein